MPRFLAHKRFSHSALIDGLGIAASLAGLFAVQSPALADKIKNPVAVFSGLDKITGRVINFEAKIDETVQFGSLQVTPRVCYTRPQTEAPRTDAFAEVDEVQADKQFKRIFSGWMFSASPGLHGVEHAVYDVWLTDCKGGSEVIADAPDPNADPNALPAPSADNATPAPTPAAVPAQAPAPKPRRVVRRQEPPPVAVEQRREPSQSFFPASNYPSDFGGRDPAGNK